MGHSHDTVSSICRKWRQSDSKAPELIGLPERRGHIINHITDWNARFLDQSIESKPICEYKLHIGILNARTSSLSKGKSASMMTFLVDVQKLQWIL